MFLKPQYSSWEPFSSLAATLGQLHCQEVAAAQPEFPHSLLSKRLLTPVMKCLVNAARGCRKSGPRFQCYTREKKGNLLGKPPKKGVWALSDCVKIQTVNSSGTMHLAVPLPSLPEPL